MGESLEKLLIIDDDKFLNSQLVEELGSDFDVIVAINGTEGLQVLCTQSPRLVLLDIEMPGINGYETCRQLRASSCSDEVFVVFMSSHQDLEHRVRGYQAGGDDYIVKPFQIDELKAKLANFQRRKLTVVRLAEQAKNAHDAAMTAMAGSSEMGQALAFSRTCYRVRSYREVADAMISTCSGFGLNIVVLFHTREGDFVFSRTDVSPLEKELMLRILSNGQRIFDFGSRTQISYSHVAVLVKNMPKDDPDRYGRYKDLLPFMLEAAEAKHHHMAAEQAMLQQTKQLLDAFVKVEKALSGVACGFESHHAKAKEIFTQLLLKLEMDLPRLGLEEDQEDYLRDMIFKAVDSSMEETNVAAQNREIFDSIISIMHKLVEKQQLAVDDIVLKGFSADAAEPAPEATAESNVELF